MEGVDNLGIVRVGQTAIGEGEVVELRGGAIGAGVQQFPD
jgi:hypothetical protein